MDGRTVGDAPWASNGIAAWGGWRGGRVGDAPRGRQVHAPGMTPGPPLPPLSALGRAVVERGVEKKHSRADLRGPAAAAASEGGERVGVARPQAGPRALGGGHDGAG